MKLTLELSGEDCEVYQTFIYDTDLEDVPLTVFNSKKEEILDIAREDLEEVLHFFNEVERIG